MNDIIHNSAVFLIILGSLAAFINLFYIYYLDASNGHDKTRGIKFSWEGMTNYDREVKKEDEGVKKNSNLLAKTCRTMLTIGCILFVIDEVIKIIRNGF